jgi:ribosomal protein S18 acetylase RimI-like enzyme
VSAPLATRRAVDVPLDVLVEAWNRAYTGYPVDVRRDAAGFAEHVRSTSVDLGRSLVQFDTGLPDGPVALALLGVRSGRAGDRGWVAGFGVAPWHRGRGLAVPLAADLLDVAARAGVREVSLEVLTSNTAARRTYERVGFAARRRLLVLSGRLEEPAAARADDGQLLEPGAVDDAALAWAHERVADLSVLPGGQAQPWGREPRHVGGGRDLVVGFAGPRAAPTAVVIGRVVRPPRASTGATVLTVLTASALDATARADGRRCPPRSFAGATCRVANEPERSTLADAFREAGLAEVLDQHEMHVDLSRRAIGST